METATLSQLDCSSSVIGGRIIWETVPIITFTKILMKRDKNIFSFFQNWMVLICKNLNSFYQRMLCAKLGWNWLNGSGEEDFKISSMYFCYFIIFFPWKRVGYFIWLHLNPNHSKMIFVKFGWNLPCVQEKKIFIGKICQWICPYFVIFPWKRNGPFIWNNLNSLHPRMDCAKFGWNWPSGSGEEDF